MSLFVNQIIAQDEQMLEIGIFRRYKSLKSIHFTPKDNSYKIYDEKDSLIYHLQKGEIASIRKSSNGRDVKLKVPDEDLGYYSMVRIVSDSKIATYTIKGHSPVTKSRKYYDGIECSVFSNRFNVVSLVSMAHYLEGVTESESGNHQGKEYYKVQAIISRTYALKNIRKFRHEGFMLTDMVNCQVYLGKMYKNPKIIEAISETNGLVLVNTQMNFISAAFYSNSGGQTANSEDVWSKKVDYLRSVSDPFSNGKHNSVWKKTYTTSEYLAKLKKYYNYPIHKTDAKYFALHFTQHKRAKYFVSWDYHILLTDVRRDFKLKSTFFTVTEQDGTVTIKGKGFGHGVGLSQEGAMNMCDAGYSFKDVLFFYYTGVHLIDKRQRDFFLAE